MKVTKNQGDKPKKEKRENGLKVIMNGKKNKGPGNPGWGGWREESRLIKKYADQWCRDNGYPVQNRTHVHRGKQK